MRKEEKSTNMESRGKGGRRRGAGRPRGDSKSYSFRVPGEIARIIDAQVDKTAFIRNCIVASELQPLELPFFDVDVVAGFPVPLDNDERSQDINILRMLCPHPESSYLVRVKGESMIDAGICSGDIVIVDKSKRNPSEKEIAVCELNGEYTLKRFVEENGEGWLVPANPEFPRIHITKEDSFRIWGVVTYIIHKARD